MNKPLTLQELVEMNGQQVWAGEPFNDWVKLIKCAPYLEYEEAKQAEYRENGAERDRNAYTADAKKRCKSVERLRKAGLLK